MVALFRFAFCLAFPAASSALVAGGKPQPALRAAHLAPHEDGETFMVDVPVVEVIMVEPDTMESDKAPVQPAKSTNRKGLSLACEREMEGLAVNRTRVEKSRKCEDQNGYTKHAITALQHANASDALASIEKTFRECGALSIGCAKEMAPEVELKMRLSGITVESQCAKKAREAQSKMSEGKGKDGHCQENATKSMVNELAKDNLDGAMAAAMGGLSTCNSLGSPCDYQIAPILVMQLLAAKEAEQEEAMMFALVNGLRQAAERSARLTSDDKLVKSTKTGLKKSQVDKVGNSKTQTRHKALSLIDIAEHVHITSERRSVSL